MGASQKGVDSLCPPPFCFRDVEPANVCVWGGRGWSVGEGAGWGGAQGARGRGEVAPTRPAWRAGGRRPPPPRLAQAPSPSLPLAHVRRPMGGTPGLKPPFQHPGRCLTTRSTHRAGLAGRVAGRVAARRGGMRSKADGQRGPRLRPSFPSPGGVLPPRSRPRAGPPAHGLPSPRPGRRGTSIGVPQRTWQSGGGRGDRGGRGRASPNKEGTRAPKKRKKNQAQDARGAGRSGRGGRSGCAARAAARDGH